MQETNMDASHIIHIMYRFQTPSSIPTTSSRTQAQGVRLAQNGDGLGQPVQLAELPPGDQWTGFQQPAA